MLCLLFRVFVAVPRFSGDIVCLFSRSPISNGIHWKIIHLKQTLKTRQREKKTHRQNIPTKRQNSLKENTLHCLYLIFFLNIDFCINLVISSAREFHVFIYLYASKTLAFVLASENLPYVAWRWRCFHRLLSTRLYMYMSTLSHSNLSAVTSTSIQNHSSWPVSASRPTPAHT